MKKFVLVGLSVCNLLLLAGCATVNKQPLSQDAAAQLRGQSVALTSRKNPDFAAMTPAKAAFGLIGAAVMISEGNKIVAENEIADPAAAIATELTSALAARFDARASSGVVRVASSDVADIIDAGKSSARFIVDVETMNWSFSYFPADWTHYRVVYMARARVIDTRGNVVVAEGSCKHAPESNTNAPTYDDLLADDAALLKAQLATVTNECIENLKSEMLFL